MQPNESKQNIGVIKCESKDWVLSSRLCLFIYHQRCVSNDAILVKLGAEITSNHSIPSFSEISWLPRGIKFKWRWHIWPLWPWGICIILFNSWWRLPYKNGETRGLFWNKLFQYLTNMLPQIQQKYNKSCLETCSITATSCWMCEKIWFFFILISERKSSILFIFLFSKNENVLELNSSICFEREDQKAALHHVNPFWIRKSKHSLPKSHHTESCNTH